MKRRKFLFRLFFITMLFALLISCTCPKTIETEVPIVKGGGLATPGIIGTLATWKPWWWIDWHKFIHIPGIHLCLGSSPEEDKLAQEDETPQTLARLTGFWIGQTEVTNEEYALCEEAGVCTPPQTSTDGACSHYRDPKYANFPVVCVNWFQADTFCRWIDARLPTEAEWEGAARDDCSLYPWGDEPPTCDLLNYRACTGDDPCPNEAGGDPGDVTSNGVLGMAGGVREWVLDFYDPDGYANIALFNPTGPSEGNERVIRGGSCDDFEENLRSASRNSAPPEAIFENVGFRCVPITDQYAPFCPPTFTPLCEDPDTPPRDEPCIPGETTQPGEEGVTIAGVDCPWNGVHTIRFDTNGGGNVGYTATVNGEVFNCEPFESGGDIVECSGPEQPMGTTANITICSGGASSTLASSLTPTGGITLASVVENDALLQTATTASHCPDGYEWQPGTPTAAGLVTGECVRIGKDLCPPGWYISALYECQPETPDACPPGTEYFDDQKGCVPASDECPDGYRMTDRKTCEPDQNSHDDCLRGYFFNEKIQCCQPLKGDNYGCDDQHYWDPRYQRCLPIDGNGCGFNMLYDGFARCQIQPYQPGIPSFNPGRVGGTLVPGVLTGGGPWPLEEGQCPENLVFAVANTCNTPPGGSSEEKPDPNQTNRPGDGQTSDDCPPETAKLAAYDNCIGQDDDDCPYGYIFNGKFCVPDNGPGSPCPPGYKISRLSNCCVPIPGNDGSRCPEDEKREQAAAAGQEVPPETKMLVSSFNVQSGDCEPRTTEENRPDCPPGYIVNANGVCEFQGQETLLMMTTGAPAEGYNANNCPPGYWNEKANTCDYPPPCEDYEYFDPALGYCVSLGDDCCPPGFDFSLRYKRCLPIVQDNTPRKPGEPCKEGYENIDGVCLLIERGAGGQCWTLSVNLPRCFGRCEVGKTWNQVTGRCEKPTPVPDPCANVNCGLYKEQKLCPSNCCQWVSGTSGGYCTKR
jgi:hypothetical protein